MKYVFNFKLYLEGLKKIRLVGIIAGIIVIISNALPPIVTLLGSQNESYVGYKPNTTILTASNFAIPSLLLLFLTPFFFLSMYSFLNKRNESDFYHAIPYKRSCVLVTFLASIYTWIWGILLVSLLLTGALWAVCPNVSFAFSVIPQLFGVYAATALYIGSFVLLAMTLTGTAISNLAVTGILLFFVRIVGSIITVILDDMVPILDLSYSPLRFLSMGYYLPAAILTSFYDSAVFKSVGLWIYSFVIMALLYALAIFCYCRRKSESANKSALNRKLQHVFRCAFTLPLALITAYLIYTGEDLSFIVVMMVVTLMAYFLYELITTKNLRSTLRSTPMLLVPFLCCALIIGGCFLTRASVLESAYEPDDIASVRTYNYSSLFDLFMRGSDSYESLATAGIRIPDREAAKVVSEALKMTIRDIKGEESIRWDENVYSSYVEITLNSGRRVGRQLFFKENAYRQLMKTIQDSEEYRKAYISMPESKRIQSIYAPMCDGASNSDLMRLWETFVSEYNALTDDEKVEFKARYRFSYNYGEYVPDSDYRVEDLTSELFLNAYGAIGTDTFNSIYHIPESFTETRAVYFEVSSACRNDAKKALTDFAEGRYDKYLLEDERYAWLDLSYNLINNGNGAYRTFNTGSYELNNQSDGFGMQFARDSYEKQKDLAKRLLPYLTDTPAEKDYLIFELMSNFYDENGNDSYIHQQAFFGISDLPEDLLTELSLGDYAADAEEVLGFMKAYTDGQTSDYLTMLAYDASYLDLFTLSVEGTIGTANDADVLSTYANLTAASGISFEERYEASKSLCALLLTHLQPEVSAEAPACTVCFSTYDNNGYWWTVETKCGLVPFEGDDLEKLEKLVEMIY